MSMSRLPPEIASFILEWLEKEKQKRAKKARENLLEAISYIVCKDCAKKIQNERMK